jgi:hypothetical protein
VIDLVAEAEQRGVRCPAEQDVDLRGIIGAGVQADLIQVESVVHWRVKPVLPDG